MGADSALNMIVDSIDRVRQAGTASRRCFVVETMGHRCGYLALMGALSGGAVQVYLHEEGITLAELAADVERMVESFRAGQRIFVTVINEKASPMYTTEFLCRLFEQESQGLFDAREVVLGPTQQGGTPSPFDRILATRLAAHSMDWLRDQIDSKKTGGAVIGMHEGGVRVLPLPRHRGARRLGEPAPGDPVVDAAAPDDRRAGQPARCARGYRVSTAHLTA